MDIRKWEKHTYDNNLCVGITIMTKTNNILVSVNRNYLSHRHSAFLYIQIEWAFCGRVWSNHHFVGYQDEMIAGKNNHQGKVKNIN